MGERLEIFGRRQDGSEFPADASISKLEQDGEITFTVILRDITERKQAEIKIQQQLERLTALREIDRAIASTFDVRMSLNVLLSHTRTLLIVDAATVLLLNPVQSRLEYGAGIGFRTRAVETAGVKLGKSYAGRAAREQHLVQIPSMADDSDNFLLTGFLKEEDFVSYHGMPLIIKGKVVGVLEVFNRSFIKRDQDWLDFFGTLAGQAAIAIDNAQLFENLQRSKDELEHRVAERTNELNRTNAELEHANRAKDEFLANMSHELRTPLNGILGLSESLLEQRRDPLSDYQKNSLQIIESSGRHLLELINDILDLSKIEAGMFDYYPQVVEVDTLCRSSLSFIREQALRKSIDLNYEADKTVSNVFADPRRLKQILVNLLSNAVKFTPNNGQVTLQVHADAEQDLIHLSVIDNGIGIAPEDLKQLFQPFVQVDNRLNRQFEGTGLGLALVQKLADLHGGSVHVESEVGLGSRFTIKLLWGKDRLTEKEAIESGSRPPTRKKSGKSDMPSKETSGNGIVLLAEDNAANTLTIGEYLESHGYTIENAHDGLEAIKKAEETNPNIILMDIQMPAMGGLEAIRRLRTNPRFATTPIIALTALTMPGDRERCIEAGASEYMSKPVGLKKLLYTINEMLDR
jgi:signal transduction histidine kinase/CheY-like chemotaxis protein